MISICTPARDMVHAAFAADLVRLVQVSGETEFILGHGGIVCNLRCELARMALERGASHVLFVDSDMRFPPDALERLLRHDVAIVGANYPQRTKIECTASVGSAFINSAGRSGCEEVDGLGMGFALIKAAVFRTLDQPWFSSPFGGRTHVTEDVFFCYAARKAGFSVWVDHDLSQQVRHLALVELGIPNTPVA